MIYINYAIECFRDIFNECNKVFDNINSFEDHSFYKLIKNNWNSKIGSNDNSSSSDKLTCDEIFFNYIKEESTKLIKNILILY
jgi:ribonuclease HIII